MSCDPNLEVEGQATENKLVNNFMCPVIDNSLQEEGLETRNFFGISCSRACYGHMIYREAPVTCSEHTVQPHLQLLII